VVAGAGTGKTSVVVSKVGYLVQRLEVPPAEFLLLAYNRSASKELEERLRARIGVDVRASTFHALGYDIIRQSTPHPASTGSTSPTSPCIPSRGEHCASTSSTGA